MWGKIDEMDEDKKARLMEKLKELGIAEEKVDESLMWTIKKISHKISKLRLILDEKGVEDSKVKEIIVKLVAKTTEKDLAKIKQWHNEHEHKNHQQE